jgi:uncharacterized repeat protein (TIGR02543 family)
LKKSYVFTEVFWEKGTIVTRILRRWLSLGAALVVMVLGFAPAGLAQQTFVLTVSVTESPSDPFGGNVVDIVPGQPPSITCGVQVMNNCSGAFAANSTVTLKVPFVDSITTFAGWGGACASSGTNTACTITMTSNQTVTATFVSENYTLTTTTAGAGTIASSPAGINCGSQCSATFNPGTLIALTATPASGSMFVGYGGSCTGAGAVCVLTAGGGTANVFADFTQPPSGGSPLNAAVLPASRSSQVGAGTPALVSTRMAGPAAATTVADTTVTAFATIINGGAAAAEARPLRQAAVSCP